MAGTSIRKSIAEPGHLLFGVPVITGAAFAVFPIGALFTSAGYKPGIAIGIVLALLIHVYSIVIRMRQPYMQNLIFYVLLKKGLMSVIKKKRVRLYVR